MGDFREYRRNLPHWRDEGATYFVTWRLSTQLDELAPAERELVAGALRFHHPRRYVLEAYVVMNDHVHAVLRPAAGEALESILHALKSYTAHAINAARGRQGKVWQDESYDRIIRDQAEWQEKVRYVVENPFRRWPELEEYPWRWSVGMEAGGPEHDADR